MGKLPNGWTDWHQIWYTYSDSSGIGHRLNTICPSIPRRNFGGGVRGSQLKKSGEATKGPDRLAPTVAHMCSFIWEWIYAKQLAPRDTRGTWVFRGVKHSKVWGSCQTAGPIGTNLGSRLRIHLGMDIG